MDIGSHLLGFSIWFVTAVPAVLVGSRLVARWLGGDHEVPARGWVAAFIVWILAASLAGGAGLVWLALLLVLPLLWFGSLLAERSGWPRRRAWLWSAGSFASFWLFVLLGRGVLQLRDSWMAYGWWVVIASVWLAWLLLPTALRRTQPNPPAP